MTVVNKYTMNATVHPILVVILGVAIVILIAFFCIFMDACYFGDKNSAVILLVLILCTMIGVIVLAASLADKAVCTVYEVTLSDDYPASELLENYEIVEQRGEILVIRDKKQEKEDQNGELIPEN